MRVTATHAISGTFLPKACFFAQDTADGGVVSQRGLANSPGIDNVETVVVAPPQRAKAQSLIRYPSPCRRSCAFRHGPPLFRAISKSYSLRRRPAHGAASRICTFATCAPLRLDGTRPSFHSPKGTEQCEHMFSKGWRSAVAWALQPAAKLFPNRRFSARGRGSAPLRCWTAALPRARSSGLRAASRTAKPTRIVVTEFASRRSSARKSSHRTIGAVCAGGPFCVMPMRPCAGPRTERRDQPCSRRS